MKENELINILRLGNEAVILLNKDLHLVFANMQALSMFPGFGNDEHPNVKSLIVPDDYDRLSRITEQEGGAAQGHEPLKVGLKFRGAEDFYADASVITADQSVYVLIYFREKTKNDSSHDAFYRHSTEGWLFIDSAGLIRDFNKKAQKLIKLISGRKLEKGLSYVVVSSGIHVEPIQPLIEEALQGKALLTERRFSVRSYEVVIEIQLSPVYKASRIEGIVLSMRNITASRRLESKHQTLLEELKKSEARYKGLIDNAFDGIYMLSGRRFTYVNKRFEEMTGYTFKEVSADDFDFSVTLTERSRKIVEERYQARLRGDNLPSKYVFEIRTKPGSLIDVEITTVSLGEGADVQVMGIMRDITLQLKTKDALENERAFFRHLIESLPFGLALLDEDDRIKGTNSAFKQLFGYNEDELAERRINEVIVPDFLSKEGEDATKKVTVGKEIRFETKRRRKDGLLLDVSVTGKPIQLPSGEKMVFGIYQDISENLLIKKAILDEKAYFQGLFEIIPFGIVLLYGDGEVVDCNSGFETLFGFSKKEMLGRDKIKLIYPEGYDEEGKKYRDLVEKGKSVYFETVRKRKDGNLMQVAVTARPLKRPDGEVFVFAIYQDITDRKKAEEALKESEMQLSNLIGNLPGMVYRCKLDKDYTMTFVSEGSTKIFGYTPKKFTDKKKPVSFNEMILPHYREAIWNKWQQVIAKNDTFEHEYQIADTQGVIKWVWERGRGVSDAEGNLQYLEGYIEDITDRKNAGLELAQERELMQALMDNIPDTIYFKDRESRFIRINFAQAHLLGLSKPEDAFGKNDSDFFNKEHAQMSFEQEQELMETGISLINQQEHIQTAQGWMWFTATKVPMYDGTGQIFGLVGVSRDITEIKNMEHLLRDNELKLRKTNAEKDKLFSVIAHDLRGPFNSFLMLTEIFNDDTLEISMDEMKSLLNTMHKSASALVDLLENLLNWSRVQRGLAAVEQSVIPVREMLQKSVDYFDTHVSMKMLKINIFSVDGHSVLADPSMLSSVIRNLVSNAVKFTPEGGEIKLSSESTKSNSIIIRIKDSGIGIPETMKKSIFSMENKGRQGTNNEPSSGLGLLLVKEFVEINQGHIWFESADGKGTEFFLELPAGHPENIQ